MLIHMAVSSMVSKHSDRRTEKGRYNRKRQRIVFKINGIENFDFGGDL